MADKVVVAKAAEIPEGERLLVEVNGRSIGIFNVDGEYYGLVNRCPHMGAEMCRGHIVSELTSDGPGEFHFDPGHRLIMCPWHGWEYDLKTGQSWCDPTSTRIRTYGIEVEQGKLVSAELADGSVEAEETKLATESSGDRFIRGKIEGPYKAETVEVTVEDDYLVVNLRPPRPPRRPRPEASGSNAGN
jgi:3-phenylpropionate/trans-cinnamate dioxygenase ferredoxin subunit